jgi:hypothetical protein
MRLRGEIIIADFEVVIREQIIKIGDDKNCGIKM